MIGYGIILFAELKIILRLFCCIKEVYVATFLSTSSDSYLRICFKKIEKDQTHFAFLRVTH